MPVTLKNNIALIKEAVAEGKVAVVNSAAKEHRGVSASLTPVDEGRLRKSNRIARRATEKQPSAVVKCGGNVVDGELVDYAEPVNNGHATSNGGHVPGVHFFDEGMEYGLRALREGVAEVARGLGTGSRRPLVVTSLEEAEEVGGPSGDG